MAGARRAAARPRGALRRMAGATAAAAVVAVAVAASVGGQEAPPPASPYPPALAATLASGSPVFSNTGIEAPFEFRINAASVVAIFDCVAVYAANDRRYTTWDGRPVVRAPRGDRTDDNLGVCGAAAISAVVDYVYGRYGSDPMYASVAKAGIEIPRLNDTARCGERGGGRPDPADPACVGLAAARQYIAEQLQRDGMNQDGRTGLPPGAPPRPYADTVSGYRPVNGPAAGVTALTRWMPLKEDTAGLGTYQVQSITAPHAGIAKPILADPSRLRRLRVPPPYRSPDAYRPDFQCGCGAPDPDELCAKAQGVLAQGPRLDDRRRTLIRWFDRKTQSIAGLPIRLFVLGGMSLADYLTVELALNAFTWDATIAVWAEKVRHDAVRPATLIPEILGHTRDGAAFTSVIRTMPHAEYPSASAAICSGFSHILAAAGGDALNLSVPLPAGAVGGDLPATTLTFKDTHDLAAQCGESRIWGGLHFPDAVKAGSRLGVAVAKEVLRTAACRAPGTPGLPPCAKATNREVDDTQDEAEYV